MIDVALEPAKFIREVRIEVSKVTWPTRKMVITETVVVICVVVFFTLLITGMDRVLATQPSKIDGPGVVLVEAGVADIDGIERHRFGR